MQTAGMMDSILKTSHDVHWFKQQCTRLGLKITHQRCVIYTELVRSNEHPDAETIYRRVRRRIPAVSLDTVYRNLRTLEEHQLIFRVGSFGYRTRYDADLTTHHHFVCMQCDAIFDFNDPQLFDLEPPATASKLGEIDSMHIELRGVCNACKRKGDTR